MMNKKVFMCISPVILATLVAAGCSGMKNDDGKKTVPSANAVSTIDANVFLNAEKIRAGKVPPKKDAVKLTPEQQKINGENEKKFSDARLMIWQGKNAEGEKALQALLKIDTVKDRAASMLVDSKIRQKDQDATLKLIDELLKDPALNLSSATRAALLERKAGIFGGRRKFADQANVLLERLSENITDADAFRTQMQIVNCWEYFGDVKKALEYCKLVRALNDADKKAKNWRLIGLYRKLKDTNSVLKLAEEMKSLYKDDPVQIGKIRTAIAGAYADVRKFAEAHKVYMENITDPKLSNSDRIAAFNSRLVLIREYSGAKKSVIDLANETVLKLEKLTPADYANLVGGLMKYSEYHVGMDYALKYAQSLLTYPGIANSVKIEALRHVAQDAAKNGDFAAAEATLKRALSFDKLNAYDRLQICRLAASIYKWQDKCDEGIKFMRGQMALLPENDTRNRAHIISAMSDLYAAFYRYDDRAALYREFKNPIAEVGVYAAIDTPRAKAMALKLLNDESQPDNVRNAMMGYFLDTSKESTAIRAKYPQYMEKQHVNRAMETAITGGNWQVTLEFTDLIRKNNPNIDSTVFSCAMQAYVLAGSEKIAEFEAFAKECQANPRLNETQKRDVAFIFAVLKNVADRPGAFRAFCSNYKFPAELLVKDRADLLLKTARAALQAKRFVISDEAYQLRQELYRPEPRKTYKVAYSEVPVRGILGFIQLKNQPEIQVMDRKYGGNMDFLVTDVSTGNRAGNIGASAGEKNRPTEMQIVCDVDGIHMLFTAYDSKTREIEIGAASAGSYEMYLAPGVNQPYICLLPDLTTGNNHTWNSSYNTALWRNPDSKNAFDMRNERVFTADGYKLYLFIGWQKFYDKLPDTKANYWEFENVHWSRFGGFSWNGLKTIHGRSTWGRLEFDLTPEQLRNIKRKIIFAARTAYNSEKRTTAASHGAIEQWRDDPMLGDPKFFRERMAATAQQLDDYTKLVKADMSDETVDMLFDKAVPGWFEIKHKVADERRRYLEEELSK